MKRLTACILFFFVWACSVDKTMEYHQVISLDDVKNEIEFEDIRFIKLETNPDILLGNDIFLKISEDKIFILDKDYQKCVLCYSNVGIFLSKIGKKGKGPGEYIEIRDFIIKNDEVEILSGAGASSTISKYNIEGQFLGKTDISYAAFSFENISDDYYAIGTGYNKSIHKNRIYIVDKNGKEVEKLLPNQTDIKIPVVENTFTKFGSKIYYRESFNNQVYSVEDFQLTVNYELNFGKYSIPEKFYKSDILKGFEMINKNGFSNIFQYLDNQRYAFFEIRQQKAGENTTTHLLLFAQTNDNRSIISFGEEENTIFRHPVGITKNNELIFLIYPYDLKSNSKEMELYDISENLKNLDVTENPYIAFCKI
jgi:hypothetical protein